MFGKKDEHKSNNLKNILRVKYLSFDYVAKLII